MNAKLKTALAVAATAFATHAFAQVTFFENEGFTGRSFTANRPIDNFQRSGFNNRASSVVVVGDRWELCEGPGYGGRCVVLRPGRYPSLASLGLNDRVSSIRDVAREARIEDSRYAPLPMGSQITFYEQENFRGRSFSTDRPIDSLRRSGFSDSAASVIVAGDSWEACEDARFGGRCVILRPGNYPSIASMGLRDRVASVRDINPGARVDENRYPPAAAVPPDYRRGPDERFYEATVTSVRAVVAASGQRCWMERAEVAPERGGGSVGGAVAGAIIGGILGHQVGRGSGKDLATAGGAVAGAAVGANVGRSPSAPQTQEVQRCENVSRDARPDYWDVTYNFRGIEHRVQMSAPPGPTILVNERGEPRA
jgi:uncharacterized protein YcfJ